MPNTYEFSHERKIRDPLLNLLGFRLDLLPQQSQAIWLGPPSLNWMKDTSFLALQHVCAGIVDFPSFLVYEILKERDSFLSLWPPLANSASK